MVALTNQSWWIKDVHVQPFVFNHEHWDGTTSKTCSNSGTLSSESWWGQITSSPLVWYGEGGLVLGRLWWNLPEFWGRQAFVQSGVSKEGSGRELPLSSLPLGFSWRVEGGAWEACGWYFFLDRLWKALNHFICRTDLFLWLVILDDQGSKGSWWVDVVRYIKALSPQTWYCSIPLSPGQNQGAWPTPTNEASSVELGRIIGNLRKVNPVLPVCV